MGVREVGRYAERWLAGVGEEHGVWSPLGVWLLLALVAPLTTGSERAVLESELGTDADSAADQAARLLAWAPESVAAAVAVWADAPRLLASYLSWRLPAEVTRAPLPDQAGADRWAREHTGGLVDRFPVTIEADTLLLLTSALATRVTWDEPLAVVPAGELGGRFGPLVAEALRMAPSYDQWTRIIETDAAGLVAVSRPFSSSGLDVLSVIAAAEVAPVDVHRAALEVASNPEITEVAVSGDGHAWTLTERRLKKAPSWTGLEYEWMVTAPSWRATGNHHLDGAPGVETALGVLGRFARPEDQPPVMVARQAVEASFTATGFEAAAVTAFAWMAGSASPPERKVTVREVHVRFNRPYAVLATVAPWVEPTAWRGMPTFSAWVADPRLARATNRVTARRGL